MPVRVRAIVVSAVVACAVALVACHSAATTAPAFSSSKALASCTATLASNASAAYNGAFAANETEFRLNFNSTDPSVAPAFYVYCVNDMLGREVAVFLQYPPRLGTITYVPDSGVYTGLVNFLGGGAEYSTLGAGGGGSATVTAYNPATGAISGYFSFTANIQRAGFGAPRQLTVTGSFTNATHEQ
jgi:hypothetical protein